MKLYLFAYEDILFRGVTLKLVLHAWKNLTSCWFHFQFNVHIQNFPANVIGRLHEHKNIQNLKQRYINSVLAGEYIIFS